MSNDLYAVMDSVVTTIGTVDLMKLFRESVPQTVLEVSLRFDLH
jgi:hypothetical protein